jgi:hypothetical protein
MDNEISKLLKGGMAHEKTGNYPALTPAGQKTRLRMKYGENWGERWIPS